MRPLTPSAVYDAWIRYFGMRHLPTKSIGGLSERLDPGPPLPPRGPDGRGGGATLGGGGGVCHSRGPPHRVPPEPPPPLGQGRRGPPPAARGRPDARAPVSWLGTSSSPGSRAGWLTTGLDGVLHRPP